MISICIPVFNFNIDQLAHNLDLIIRVSPVPCEIIIADDGSLEEFKLKNNEIAAHYGIKMLNLEKNIGRASIRNLLCKVAAFENLIFIDCDSFFKSYFLTNYIPYLDKNVVVYGGTLYEDEPPEKDFLLHWNYGRKREIKPVHIRNTFSTRYFKTNNFLVPRSVLLKFPFNENLRGYGHEDTLLGIDFYQNGIPVIHIENPVLHIGLDDNTKFLLKTESAIRNLITIDKEVEDKKLLQDHVTLLKAFYKVEKLKFTAIAKVGFMLFKPVLLLLIRKFYAMRALDIYKLGYLCTIYKKSTALSNDASSE